MLCIPSNGIATSPTAATDVVRLTLAAGGQANVDVRRGSVWLTEDRLDHVLDVGARFTSANRCRVVITAFPNAAVDVRRQRRC